MSHRLDIADLSSIETRVAAWICGCGNLLQVFKDDKDAYLDFAVKITGIPYETLAKDVKSKDPAIKAAAKGHRQFAKPGVLGCVYRLGGGGVGKNEHGDMIKTGLWGYAENYGVEMSMEKAHEMVRVFRESYPEIKQFWFDAEKAVIEVLEGGPRMKRFLGPDNIIEIDKILIAGRYPLMRIKLPSGRYLHYLDARIEEISMPWKKQNQETGEEEPVFKKALVYAGQNQKTKQWSVVNAHGGKTLENIVQGIARDVLAESLMKFEFELDLPVVGHVHDESICEVEDDVFSPGVEVMERVMSEPISWAPGLPLGADGFESFYYRK